MSQVIKTISILFSCLGLIFSSIISRSLKTIQSDCSPPPPPPPPPPGIFMIMGTNVEITFAFSGDPSDDHVRSDHSSVRGQSKSHPSRSLDHHVESNGLLDVVKGPVELVDGLTRSWVRVNGGGEGK